jgi:FdhE protein
VTEPTRPRLERQDPPDIAALKRLKQEQPELAGAVDMQIELVMLLRRTQARLTTPWANDDPIRVQAHLAAGRPLLRLEDVAFDWVALRVLFRQIADVLGRFDIVEGADHAALLALARDGRPSAEDVAEWFAARQPGHAPSASPSRLGDSGTEVLTLAARPFLERAASAVRARLDLAAWHQPYCPLCGASPEMSSYTAAGDRRLHCGACGTAWEFDAGTCPSCGDRDPGRRVSYGSPDGRYRLVACTACRRYLKGVDGRRMERPLMLDVDGIATLRLDAAAVQKGFGA